MDCPHCGATIDEGDSFCPNCGTKLEEGEELDAGLDDSQASVRDRTDRYRRRFGWLNLGLAGVALFIFASLLYASRVGFREGLVRVQSQSFIFLGGYILPLTYVYLALFLAFGVVGIIALWQYRMAWYVGVGWYILILIYSLYPPSTIWLAPVALLGLYWGVRGLRANPT